MALDKATLKAAIISAMTSEITQGDIEITAEQTAAFDRYATKLSDAIDAFVRSGSVQPGQTVQDVGGGVLQTTTSGTIS